MRTGVLEAGIKGRDNICGMYLFVAEFNTCFWLPSPQKDIYKAHIMHYFRGKIEKLTPLA